MKGKKGFDKSKERIRIEKELLKKKDDVKFEYSKGMVLKIRRIAIELNRLAREGRIIGQEQRLYTTLSNKEAGYVQIVRNY